jgi:hypothetical protein
MDKRTARNQRRNEIGGWILTALGTALLIIFGKLYEPGMGEAIGSLIAIAMIALGLYFALRRKTPEFPMR